MVLNLDEILKLKFIYIFIPTMISIVICWSLVNPILRKMQIHNVAKFFFLLITNSTALFLLLFSIFICLKIDGVLNWDYSIILTPLYILCFIYIAFACFIIPGLLDSEIGCYREAFIILGYLLIFMVNLLIFTLILE